MDAKKEAEELVGKIFNEMPTNLQGKKGFYTSKKIALISIEGTIIGSYMLMNTDQAIQCALISIEGTIKALWEVEHSFYMEKIKELAKVKKEIIKL